MRFVVGLLASALFATTALAADPTQPHPHQGVVAAFVGAPPVPQLTADDLATLASGRSVLKQTKNPDGSGRGVSVQDIHADPEKIWARITNYKMYPTWVENVYACEAYKTDGSDIRARFLIGTSLIKYEYYVKHTYKPADHYMTWTLDYARLSDLDDVVGFWRVEPLAEKPGYTRVFYSVSVKLGGWTPAWVGDMLAKNGLTSATTWVKRESERP